MTFSESFFAARFGIERRDLERYLAEALSHGGDYADLYFEYLATSTIGIDEGIVKTATQGVSLGVGVRVIAGERDRLRLLRRPEPGEDPRGGEGRGLHRERSVEGGKDAACRKDRSAICIRC